MIAFAGLAKVKKIKKSTIPRTIAGLSTYDLDFVNNTYKGGTVTFTGGGLTTDIFKYTGYWFYDGHTEQADGSVVLKPANNLRRTDLGIWVEQSRTNSVLWSRDLTNAVWVKTNITAVKTVTGLDNLANSASNITATATNATILQPITLHHNKLSKVPISDEKQAVAPFR